MDRFALRLSLGYVAPEAEVEILSAQESEHPLERISACVSVAEVLALKARVKTVRVSAELKRYAVDLVRATRGAGSVLLGAGPRASLALTHTAQALALADGEEFVRPSISAKSRCRCSRTGSRSRRKRSSPASPRRASSKTS